MTHIELHQLVKGMPTIASLLDKNTFGDKYDDYIASVNRLNRQIDRYLAPGAAPFDNQALGEVLDTLSSMRRSLPEIPAEDKPTAIVNIEAQLDEMEKLFSQVDVNKGRTLSACIDDLSPRTVKVGGEMDHMDGAASERNMLKRTSADGKEISGFFTEEKLLFEVSPEIASAFYAAKNSHSGDKEFQDFCQKVEKSTYGLRSLCLCMSESYTDNALLLADEEDIPDRAYNPEIMEQFGLLPGTEENPDANSLDQLQTLISNRNICSLLASVRKAMDDSEVIAASNEYKRYGNMPYSGVQAEAGSSMTGRNIAMSRVANLLGISSIVARSSPIAVESNGVTTQGVFMEKAEGLDYPKKTEDIPNTPFIDLPQDAFDGAGLESVADLQILDYLCQNVDRHQNNMLYSFDQNGKLKSVNGIDHDLAFGTVECEDNVSYQNGVSLNALGVISESTAKAVRRMTPQMLKNALNGTGLTTREIDAACKRLEKLQNALTAATEFKPGEKAEEGKLKIVPKEAWKDIKRKDLSIESPDAGQNTFRVVGNVATAVKNKQADLAKGKIKRKAEASKPKVFAESKSVNELDPDRLLAYQASIARLNNTLKGTEGLFHGSSQDYKIMRTALDRFVKLKIEPGKTLTELEQQAYYDRLTDVSKAVSDYISYKQPRGDTGSTAETRLSTALELRGLVSPHLDNFRDAMHQMQEEALNKVSQELQEEDRKYDAIVESLTVTICEKDPDAVPGWVQDTIRNGGTLKEMVKKTEDLDKKYEMSIEDPAALYKDYVKALAAVSAKQNSSAPVHDAAQRDSNSLQKNQNTGNVLGGKFK